jgi:hypothetical protein
MERTAASFKTLRLYPQLHHVVGHYPSWLNQVEIWVNIFARDVLKDGVWRSKKQLVGQIMEYISKYNELWAKPFKWTYTGKPVTV